ncbi:hypothetical protein L332_03370 [Agrococcus pavilionensis RW1]|uniref:Uncharacterized protein n=2 Tax=Agrococcus TaxID=46352 RepID=U1MS52_9MICO|nr:hypothetical protein L332_03370 [Agrococcus pavilionensis RW1]
MERKVTPPMSYLERGAMSRSLAWAIGVLAARRGSFSASPVRVAREPLSPAEAAAKARRRAANKRARRQRHVNQRRSR